MKKISVFLADDHKILRESLKLYLSQEPEIEVVGEASDGLEAFDAIMRLKPEIAILDISMAKLNGLDLCLKLKQEFGDLKVIILSMHKAESYIYKALNIGVNAYVLKDNALEDLMNAIRSVWAGRMFISQDLLEMVVNGYIGDGGRKVSYEADGLSVREREIMQMLAEGRSNKEVADSLHLSIKTIETHRANIMKKLGLKNIADLVLYAVRNQLIDI